MISDSWEKLIVCVVYPWDNVLAGQFSSGQLCMQKITWKKIFLGRNFRKFGVIVWERSSRVQLSGRGAIFLGVIVRGAIIRGNYPGGSFSRWQLSSGDSCLGGNNVGRNCPEGNYPGNKFPRRQLSGHHK